MKLLGFFLASIIFGSGLASAAPGAEELLAASDAIRNPGRAFSVTVTLTEFQAGKQIDSSTLVSYSRTQEQGGQFASVAPTHALHVAAVRRLCRGRRRAGGLFCHGLRQAHADAAVPVRRRRVVADIRVPSDDIANCQPLAALAGQRLCQEGSADCIAQTSRRASRRTMKP